MAPSTKDDHQGQMYIQGHLMRQGSYALIIYNWQMLDSCGGEFIDCVVENNQAEYYKM